MSESLEKIAKDESKLEMTPMIDITFLLLVFFLCTIKFKTLEGKLQAFLPRDVGPNPSAADDALDRIDVRVDAERPFDETDRALSYRVGPYETKDLDVLTARLARLFEADPERALTIDPRDGVVHQDVIALLDRVIEVGFLDVTFVGASD